MKTKLQLIAFPAVRGHPSVTGLLMTLICFMAQTRPATAERYVVVGDPGNPAAPANSGGAAGRGSVQNNFRIGKWEVTNGEWVAFLNTVATGRVDHADPHGLYDSRMTSDPRGGITRQQEGTAITGYDLKANMRDKPVNFVSYYDALRYCNWHHNEQSDDPDVTEDGAYKMGSATREANNEPFARRPGARFWLPNLDEWVKAAHYNPSTGSYSQFPMVPPAPAVPASASADGTGDCANPGPSRMNYAASADWNGLNGNLLTVGSCNSHSVFGAYDMGGNAYELTETQSPQAASTTVYICGGAFISPFDVLKLESLTDVGFVRSLAGATVGLRLASADPPPIWQIRLSFHFTADGLIHITVPTQIGCQYWVQGSDDLEEWFPLALFSGTGGPRIVHYTPPLLGNWESMFFRALEYGVISNTP